MKQGRSQVDVMNYLAPRGPKNIDDPRGPGLHGDNCDNCGSQGDGQEGYERKQTSGRPGLGGENCGTSVYQGKH